MRKITLKKDYAFRHDIVIETGSTMLVGEMRAIQLRDGGFCDLDIDVEKAKAKHEKAINRKQKEEAPTVVTHKIEE